MIKKLFFLALLTGTCFTAAAKKVKFAVDMTGLTVNSTGVHVTGDFQSEAGFGLDWMSDTTEMMQETADTNIYSIVVDIPAFTKYEYKFVNGDQFYEAEFVPFESRVGYFFNDNRWLYVDSLANDTTFVGAIMFAGNAPKGYHLLRLKVDLSNEAAMDPNGTHVAGSFQSFNPATSIMYKLNDTIDELIVYIDTLITSAQFRYVNGNTTGSFETVPGSCNVFGNREALVPKDTVLNTVCFSSCSACLPAGIAENTESELLHLYPNPATDIATLEFEKTGERDISIVNILGSTVRSYGKFNGTKLQIEKNELVSGIYFVSVSRKESKTVTKLVIR